MKAQHPPGATLITIKTGNIVKIHRMPDMKV